MNDRCPGCQVAPSEPHQDGCDWATCLYDGGQRLMCELDGDGTGHDCGQDVWTGQSHQWRAMASIGVWTRWVDGAGWSPAAAGEKGALPDMNKIHDYFRWDRKLAAWVLRDARC